MKKIIILVILILSTYNVHTQTILTAKVIGVKDGDTVEVMDNHNKTTILRLAEVDCPEKKQPYGNAAKQFTSKAVYRKTISYIITNKDRYGRSVAKVYYKNKHLSSELIKNGLGWHYKKYSNSKELALLEQKARTQRIGLWVDPNPVYPSDWRKGKRKKIYR
jgi:endonuclease YncB( thermonuclease family)